MSTPEHVILDNLISFQKSGSQNHLKVALRSLENSTHRIDFNLLNEEIKLHGLQKEWQVITDIWFWQLINF